MSSSQSFTITNNQTTFTFNPIPNVTTYEFVVIGGGGGGGYYQGTFTGKGGAGAVVQTTYNNVTAPLAISIGGGGGAGASGGGGGYTKVFSNQVKIIAAGGGGGCEGKGGDGGINPNGDGGNGNQNVPGGKGAIGLTPGAGGAGTYAGNSGSGVNGGGGSNGGSNGNAPNGGNGATLFGGAGGAGGNSTNGGNGGNGTIGGTGSVGGGGGGFGAGGGGGYGGGGGGGYAGGGGGNDNINGGGGGAGSSVALNGINTIFSPAPYTTFNYGTGGLGGTFTTLQDIAQSGIQGYVHISWQNPPPAPPISNICFPAGTPIKTDQGIVAIDQIDTSYHTIGNKRILDITQTVSLDKFLVKFPKDCLGPNWPCADTIMTREHKVMYSDKLAPAYKFLNISGEVKRVKYNGETLYNVLQENYGIMSVNNLICETLHPDNLIAKIYKNRFTDGYNDKVIFIMNDAIERKKFYEYKTIINRIHTTTF